ncbi:MAG: DHH family phosphoesterase [Candidatus Thermoplasmatota archaeon]
MVYLEGQILLQRAQKIAEIIQNARSVHIVTHIDADGLTAGAIAALALKRQEISYSIECVKQLDETVLSRLVKEHYPLVWFTDLGSSIADSYESINKIITDHHLCSLDTNTDFHLNPHLFNYDGTYEISGAGTTYLVAKALDENNTDLSSLAIVGACGDLQDHRFCKLTGYNEYILSDGITRGVLQKKLDIRYFGRETRPVAKLLQYATDPEIPGISGREEASVAFLQDLGITLKDGDYWRRWIDLTKTERQTIISAIARLLLRRGYGHMITKRIVGEIYILSQEQPGSELHEAKEYATLLNATARYGQADVGLNVCLGDRNIWFKKAEKLLLGHRHNLVEGLQYAREEKLEKRRFLQFFHAGSGIRDTIIGIVTNMLLNSDAVDRNLPIFGFADTENGDVKVSARATQKLVDKGLNLSQALKNAAKVVGGVGGGHSIAAGATIPKGKEQEFLTLVEQEIQHQLDPGL